MMRILISKCVIFVAILSMVIYLTAGTGYAQVYKDPNASVEARVTDLLGRMTLDEKIGQMTQADLSAISKKKSDITTLFMGSVLSGGSADPADISAKGWADTYDDLQGYALKTRLEIPMIYGIDAVHGHNNVSGAVIFPHNIGLGCTRNPELVERAARITAIEIAGTGIDWTFAPCIAVPRDERWGRTYEGFGETPELAVTFSPAAVRGLQGSNLSEPTSILACAKHYMGDGGTTGGDDQGNAEMNEATLRALHLPGYIAAIQQADVGSIMASYSSWNGAKTHGNKYLLTDILKVELGFKGFIVTDWAGIDQIPGSYTTDVQTGINAGIDMVMVPSDYVSFFTTLKSLVEQGKVSRARIDDAVTRILTIKFRLGLFERPKTDRTLTSLVGSAEHRAVARECVRQSLVLLKKKDGILPLAKTGIKIHVAGKNADNLANQCGGWTIGWQNFEGKSTTGTTILKAFQNQASGANLIRYTRDGSNAAGADLGIAVIGEVSYAEGAGDRTDLAIEREDVQTVRNLKQAGIPVIVILVSGRPLIINSIVPYCDALIAAWLPGTEGNGVTDVLFGDYAPVGRLGHSWPRSMKQIPINSGDATYDPLFAYDFGLNSLADAPAGSAPAFYSAAATDSGKSIDIAFSKKMADPTAHFNSFTVRVNNQLNPIKAAVLKNADPTIIQLNLTNPIKPDEVITLSYSPGSIASQDNGMLGAIVNEPVYNLQDELKLIAKIPGKIQAEDFVAMNGIQTENTSDTGGGKNVGYIDNNDWMEYEVNVATAGKYLVQFRVASSSSAGQLRLSQGSTTLATVTLPITGGWQTWQTVNTRIQLKAGLQTMRITAVKGGWNINWFSFDSDTVVPAATGVVNQFQLFQNYPNPFNPATTIKYSLLAGERVSLKIYNETGQELVMLVNEFQPAGNYEIEFDGSNFAGGVLFYKLQVGNLNKVRKMILVK